MDSSNKLNFDFRKKIKLSNLVQSYQAKHWENYCVTIL